MPKYFEKAVSVAGFLLAGVCFGYAVVQVFSRGAVDRDETVRVIRFAHWQLEGGIRDAFDVLAREYEDSHPGIRIEQVAIPERIYPQWMKTQLIGGTATDIIELGKGSEDEDLARFFVPISEWVERPNPHNVGTDLEGVRWRETILDGMQGDWNYRPNLLEFYGVPVSMFTVRIYYNRSLWTRLLGQTPPPEDFDAFVTLCERAGRIQLSSGQRLLPIAGSKDNAPAIMYRLFASQAQRLNQSLDTLGGLRPVNTDIGLAYLTGRWTLDDPAFTSGLEIMRAVGQHMQPGFVQLGREDAALYFLQGRALMIATGSWDSSSFRQQAEFDIGVFDIPLPAPDHPRHGRFLFGPGSEAETGTGLSFGITRQSSHFHDALDFLQFLSSKPGNATFSRVSGWLPAVAEVVPPEHVRPFLPKVRGYVEGFDPTLGGLGANTTRAITANLNRLVAHNGSVESFKAHVATDLADSVRDDIVRRQRNTLININRQDMVLAGHTALIGEDDERRARKVSEMLEAQNQMEANHAWIAHELERSAE